MRAKIIAGFGAAAVAGAAGYLGYAHYTTPTPAEEMAVIRHYCTDCHNDTEYTANIAFDTMKVSHMGQNAKIWEAAIRKLRGRMMPPPGRPHPSEAQYESLIAWAEHAMDKSAAAHPNPGYVPLHRMNRTEYANAVNDLLDIDVDATALLPEDDVSDGFDNVADVLQVSPAFIDQYITAARDLSRRAVGDPHPRAIGTEYQVKDAGSQEFHVEGLPLGTRGGMRVVHDFPVTGEYELNIGKLAATLWEFGQEFHNTLIATVDGKKIFETTIGGGEDLEALDQKQDAAADAINARLKNIRFKTTAGPHEVAVTFLARTFAESDARLHALTPGGGQDRILRLTSFEIRGPLENDGLAETPSRRAIFTCHPEAARDEAPCALQILSRLARRAYRRPLEERDTQELMRFYATGAAKGGFEKGVELGIAAILANPKFLYRLEPVPAGAKPGQTFALTDLELASRLSFFLWSSVPDEELIEVAAAGKLHETAVLDREVRRMLADPRAESLVTNFAFQWLKVRSMKNIKPDTEIFADVDPAIRGDMREELRRFLGSVLLEDRSVLDLLTDDHTFVNERLALHYGINDVRGDRFRRIRLEDPNRWGLLGKGAVLLVSSYPNRTSPVLRGAFILENILGTPPSPPPPNVPPFKESVEGQKATTVRERLEEHRQNPTCNGCHGILDPLGFALENFDATGRWRDEDRFAKAPIDASGRLADGTKVDGPVDLREALLKHPDQFVQTVTEKLMTFALGRSLEYYDMPAVRKIVRDAARNDYRFSALVLGIVHSPAFRMKALPASKTQPQHLLSQQVAARP